MRLALFCSLTLSAGCLDLDGLGHLHDLGLGLGTDASVPTGDLSAPPPSSWVRRSSGTPAGALTSIVVDPITSSTLYAGAATGGVWKSVDGAATWTYAGTGLGVHAITALAMSPVSSAPALHVGSSSGTMWFSKDGGATWALGTGLTASGAKVESIYAAPDGKTVFAALGMAGVYRSDNAGASWVSSTNSNTIGAAHALASNGVQTFLGTPSGVYSSSDGFTWGLFESSGSSAPPAPKGISALLYQGGTLYAASTTGVDGLWTTLAMQGSMPAWVADTSTMGTPRFQSLATFATASVSQVAASSNGTGVYVQSSGEPGSIAPMLVGGASLVTAVNELATSGPTIYAAGNGVAKSEAGAAFTTASSGLENTDVTALVADPMNPNLVLGGSSDATKLFRTVDRGAGWKSPFGSVPTLGSVQAIFVDPSNDANVYVGTSSQGFWISTDHGSSWKNVVDDSLLVPNASVTTIGISNQVIYAGTTTGLYASKNGTSWMKVASTLDSVTALVGTTDGIYAAGAATNGAAATVVFGTSQTVMFKAVSTGLPGTQAVTALVAQPSAPKTIYAATAGNGVYKTTSGGTAWSETNMGLAGKDVRGLAVDPLAVDILFAATSAGVFESMDGGATWQVVNDGLDNLDATSITITTGGRVFAGFHGDGVYALGL